jgi:hypothetical protein
MAVLQLRRLGDGFSAVRTAFNSREVYAGFVVDIAILGQIYFLPFLIYPPNNLFTIAPWLSTSGTRTIGPSEAAVLPTVLQKLGYTLPFISRHRENFTCNAAHFSHKDVMELRS